MSERSKFLCGGGGAGVVDVGGNSERSFKWGGGCGVIKESCQKHLEIGVA